MRPSASRPALALLGMVAAMVLIARTSGAGWVVVVLCGLIGLLVVATAWPAVVVMRVGVGVDAGRDATAGRPFALRIRVSGPSAAVKIRVAEPSGEWVAADVPSAGEAVVVPVRRGVVSTAIVDMRTASPLGLVWWRRRVTVPLDPALEVGPLPADVALPEVGLGRPGDDRPRPGGAGAVVVRSVRDYRAGDPARLVHWPATARRRSLVVKELEEPRSPALVVVADLRGRGDDAEDAASRAAGIALAGVHAGVPVTLVTAEASGGVVAPVSTAVDIGRRLARAIPVAPPRHVVADDAFVVSVKAEPQP